PSTLPASISILAGSTLAVAVCSAASAGGRKMAQASSATAEAPRSKPRVDICCRWFYTPLITVKDVMKGEDRLGDGSVNWQFAPLDQRYLCQAQVLSSFASASINVR